MTKELTNDPTGDFSAGQAESIAAKLSETPAHDHAAWEAKAAEARAHAAASVAKADRAIRGAA